MSRPDTEYDDNNGGYFSQFIADNATTTNYLRMPGLNIFARHRTCSTKEHMATKTQSGGFPLMNVDPAVVEVS